MRRLNPSALATVGAATAMVASAARTQESFLILLLLSLLRERKTSRAARRSWNRLGTFLNTRSARLRRCYAIDLAHPSHSSVRLDQSALKEDHHALLGRIACGKADIALASDDSPSFNATFRRCQCLRI